MPRQPAFAACTPKELPEELRLAAAFAAIAQFPPNAAANVFHPDHIAIVTQKFWGERVKDLTVGFMEPTSVAMRDKVLAVANRWGEFSCARFRWTQTSPIVRISFGRGGYYSYIGTDCLSIPTGQHTMNLQGFTLRTPESEWLRVVTHEFGHALGCPHEHQRAAIIARLNRARVIAKFMREQGWSEQQVIEQTLTPLEERSLTGASPADPVSIMAYHFDGDLTLDGQPIVGGLDFSPVDRDYFSRIYPPTTVLPPPPPPPPVSRTVTIAITGAAQITVDGRPIN